MTEKVVSLLLCNTCQCAILASVHGPNSGGRHLTGKPTLIPRPLLPEEKPGTHSLRMYKISCVKSLMHLTYPYADDYTNKNNYRVFFK